MLLLASVMVPATAHAAVIVPGFYPRVSRNLGGSALWNTCGDFNGDGRVDVAVGGNGATRVTTFYTQSDGSLPLTGITTEFLSGVSRFSSGDFNADGRADLLFLNDNNGMRVTHGQANNTFAGGGTIGPSMGSANWGRTATGDLNGDGRLDILIAIANSTSNTGSVATAFGLAGGGFSGVFGVGTTSNPVGVDVADLDGNGYGDIIVGDSSGGAPIKVAYRSSSGAYTLKSFTYGDRGYEVVARDFNGDGIPDVAAAAWNHNAIGVLLTQPNGDLGPVTFYSATSTTDSIDAGDFNADGFVDLVAASEGGSQVSVHYGNGDGTFGTRLNLFASANGTATVRVADLDGNGHDDITVAAASGSNLDVFYAIAIPEPSTLSLAALAAIRLSLRRRRPAAGSRLISKTLP
jgi:hypothetical protein